MTQRDEAKERTRQAILVAAREELAANGGVGLSMRAIARQVGIVSSAVYRYFPTREALLTTMIVESYGSLAAALTAAGAGADGDGPVDVWPRLAQTLREWALANPHEFQLVYGTPIPGYQAPPETVPAAASVAGPFLAAGARHPVEGFAGVEPEDGIRQAGAPSGVAAVVAELAALIGAITLELSGHFVGVVPPADLYAAVVDRQLVTLGLAPG